MDDYNTVVTKVLNFLSAFAIVGTIAGWFPYIAAFAGFVYYCLQIYKDETVQGYLSRRRARRISAYKRRIELLEARGKRQ